MLMIYCVMYTQLAAHRVCGEGGTASIFTACGPGNQSTGFCEPLRSAMGG